MTENPSAYSSSAWRLFKSGLPFQIHSDIFAITTLAIVTVTMVGFKDLDGWTDGHQIYEYEKLGKEFMEAIMAYSQHLRQKQALGSPSSLDGWNIMKSFDQESIQGKNRVVEIAQRVLAMTRDPATSLLLDSLQVYPIFHNPSILREIIESLSLWYSRC